MNRKWKDIKDFEKLYQVSDDGLIISKKTYKLLTAYGYIWKYA
jgi:hypothetical protein